MHRLTIRASELNIKLSAAVDGGARGAKDRAGEDKIRGGATNDAGEEGLNGEAVAAAKAAGDAKEDGRECRHDMAPNDGNPDRRETSETGTQTDGTQMTSPLWARTYARVGGFNWLYFAVIAFFVVFVAYMFGNGGEGEGEDEMRNVR